MTFRLSAGISARATVVVLSLFMSAALRPVLRADSLTTGINIQVQPGGLAPYTTSTSTCPAPVSPDNGITSEYSFGSQVSSGSTTISCSIRAVVPGYTAIPGNPVSFNNTLAGGVATGSLTQGTIGTFATDNSIVTDVLGDSSSPLGFKFQFERQLQVGNLVTESSVDLNYSFSVSGPSSGTVSLFVQIEGTQSASVAGGPPCFPHFSLCDAFVQVILSNSESTDLSSFSGRSSGTFPLTILVPYTNGTANVEVGLFDEALCIGWDCSATSNFQHTLAITGATVSDVNGNLVPDATLISQSGFNPNAIPTPEPSSLLLLSVGLLAVVGATRLKLFVS